MFPLTIKLKQRIDLTAAPSIASFMKNVENELRGLHVNKLNVDHTHISFKNYFFNGKQGRWHLMAIIDSGSFDYNNSTGILTYCFSTKRTFLITLVFSLFAALVPEGAFEPYIALFFFLWLYGMNLLTAVIRHRNFFGRIVKDKRFIQNNTTHNITLLQ